MTIHKYRIHSIFLADYMRYKYEFMAVDEKEKIKRKPDGEFWVQGHGG